MQVKWLSLAQSSSRLAAILAPFWLILAASWLHVGPSCRILTHLVPSWLHLGPSWRHLGPILAHLGSILDHLGPILGPSWPHLGPILAPSWPRGPTLPNLGQVYHHCQLDYTERLNLSQICYSRLIPSGPVFVVSRPFPSAAFVLSISVQLPVQLQLVRGGAAAPPHPPAFDRASLQGGGARRLVSSVPRVCPFFLLFGRHLFSDTKIKSPVQPVPRPCR